VTQWNVVQESDQGEVGGRANSLGDQGRWQ
jgi:hypothetical protein